MAVKLKVYCVSDIHLELYTAADQHRMLKSLFELIKIDPETPSLCCLAGDIGGPLDTKGFPNAEFGEVLKTISSHFTYTVYVAGNHEYYTNLSDIDGVNYAIEGSCAASGVKYLNRSSFRVPGTSVIVHGCTLWSRITDRAYSEMNDQRFISLDVYQREHQLDLEFLRSAKVPEMTNLVVTHHLPSYRLIHSRFKGDGQDNSGFASPLDDLVEMYDFWMCGHTHEHVSIEHEGKLRVVTNPLGYQREARATRLLTSHVYEWSDIPSVQF